MQAKQFQDLPLLFAAQPYFTAGSIGFQGER